MSSREHAKGAVCGSRIIEVYPQRDHPHERLGWSMRVNYPLLHGPRPPSRFFPSLAQRQSCILMPRNEPVRFCRCRTASRGTAQLRRLKCLARFRQASTRSPVQPRSAASARAVPRLGCAARKPVKTPRSNLRSHSPGSSRQQSRSHALQLSLVVSSFCDSPRSSY